MIAAGRLQCCELEQSTEESLCKSTDACSACHSISDLGYKALYLTCNVPGVLREAISQGYPALMPIYRTTIQPVMAFRLLRKQGNMCLNARKWR